MKHHAAEMIVHSPDRTGPQLFADVFRLLEQAQADEHADTLAQRHRAKRRLDEPRLGAIERLQPRPKISGPGGEDPIHQVGISAGHTIRHLAHPAGDLRRARQVSETHPASKHQPLPRLADCCRLARLERVMKRLLEAMVDVTTRALQSELILLNASLEEKVTQRTVQLQTEVRARLRAQEDLQRSESLLKMAGHMARLGAWMIELPTRRMVWSDELAAICEVEGDRVPSVDEAIQYCASPWRGTLRQRVENCIRDGSPFDEELQIISARGRLVWVRVMGQAVRGADSAIVRVQGTIQDITGRKQAEAERQELEARLRESQKLEAIGTFAGGIAHDFNNMLGAILGNVSLARGEVDAEHPLQVSLTQIHRTAVRGRSLVQQILAFSRRQPQAFIVQPLRPLIEEAVGMLRPMLPAMVRVETSLPDAPAWVDADSTQIHQVLINLCVNAWHAMQGSTGCIQIGLEILDDPLGDPQRRAHLWVRDNGCGMDAETRARIFEPFFTTKSGHGTGLGLAVVHGIVLAHRGSISVDSTPGRGSTFHLLFPLAPEPADTVPAWLPSSRAELPRADGRHVLYVDDDEVMTLMVERLLQRNGYRVSAFHDASAALELVKANPEWFDIAVCDFNMPTLSGLDFARVLGSIRPQLPVIISSGYLPEEAQAEAVQIGVRGLLQKQNTFDELDRLIQRVLAQ